MAFPLNRSAESKFSGVNPARAVFLQQGAITERLPSALLSCEVILAGDLTGAPPTAVITAATRCQCLPAGAQVDARY